MLEEDPEVFAAASGFVEAGDWLVQELSGTLVRNSCGAGYKGFWSRERGFPSREFFAALDPRFAALAEKLGGEITPPGRRVGGLTERRPRGSGSRRARPWRRRSSTRTARCLPRPSSSRGGWSW